PALVLPLLYELLGSTNGPPVSADPVVHWTGLEQFVPVRLTSEDPVHGPRNICDTCRRFVRLRHVPVSPDRPVLNVDGVRERLQPTLAVDRLNLQCQITQDPLGLRGNPAALHQLGPLVRGITGLIVSDYA